MLPLLSRDRAAAVPQHLEGAIHEDGSSWMQCSSLPVTLTPPAETQARLSCVQLKGAKYKDGSVVRSAAISLDGALDYEIGDREEWTMELSLWAEGFRDLLCHSFGTAIYAALCDKWCAPAPAAHAATAARLSLWLQGFPCLLCRSGRSAALCDKCWALASPGGVSCQYQLRCQIVPPQRTGPSPWPVPETWQASAASGC